MKLILLSLLTSLSSVVHAQKIDSIFVNLYTDSLKKGTYNYINVDGLLANGKYQPLDSTQVLFKASTGKFFGNSLWIDKECTLEKVSIHIRLRDDAKLAKDFVMYIKKKDDNERLPTADELMEEMRRKRKG